jgi:hypothetical protein
MEEASKNGTPIFKPPSLCCEYAAIRVKFPLGTE